MRQAVHPPNQFELQSAYIGCHAAATLRTQVALSSQMTIGACLAMCQALGSVFFGIAAGEQCACGKYLYAAGKSATLPAGSRVSNAAELILLNSCSTPCKVIGHLPYPAPPSRRPTHSSFCTVSLAVSLSACVCVCVMLTGRVSGVVAVGGCLLWAGLLRGGGCPVAVLGADRAAHCASAPAGCRDVRERCDPELARTYVHARRRPQVVHSARPQ